MSETLAWLQRRVRFYMHSIKSDASYEEEAVPDSPPRKTSALEGGTEALPVIGHVPGNADSSLLVRPLISHQCSVSQGCLSGFQALPFVYDVPGDANSSLQFQHLPSSRRTHLQPLLLVKAYRTPLLYLPALRSAAPSSKLLLPLLEGCKQAAVSAVLIISGACTGTHCFMVMIALGTSDSPRIILHTLLCGAPLCHSQPSPLATLHAAGTYAARPHACPPHPASAAAAAPSTGPLQQGTGAQQAG